MPTLEYFGIKYMKPEEIEKIKTWHAEQVTSNYQYNFKQEIVKYCRDDVKILLQSILIFRENLRKISGFDPLTNIFTLPAFVSKCFEQNG